MHTDARTAADTDWGQVAALYDQLRVIAPSPFVELNRAVAVAELDGPEVALALVDRLDMATYHAWHATRADLLRRLGRSRGRARGVRRRDRRHGQRGRGRVPVAAARPAGRLAASQTGATGVGTAS